MFAERAAKRERRPKRARVMVEEEVPSAGQRCSSRTWRAAQPLQEFPFWWMSNVSVDTAAKRKVKAGGRKSVFDQELTNTNRKSLKNYRAGWDCSSARTSVFRSTYLSECPGSVIPDLHSQIGSILNWTGSGHTTPGRCPFLLEGFTCAVLMVVSFRYRKKWNAGLPAATLSSESFACSSLLMNKCICSSLLCRLFSKAQDDKIKRVNTFNIEIQSNTFGFLQLEKQEQVGYNHEPIWSRQTEFLPEEVDCLSAVSTFKVIQRRLILSRIQCVYIPGRTWFNRQKLIPAKTNHFSFLKESVLLLQDGVGLTKSEFKKTGIKVSFSSLDLLHIQPSHSNCNL